MASVRASEGLCVENAARDGQGASQGTDTPGSALPRGEGEWCEGAGLLATPEHGRGQML